MVSVFCHANIHLNAHNSLIHWIYKELLTLVEIIKSFTSTISPLIIAVAVINVAYIYIILMLNLPKLKPNKALIFFMWTAAALTQTVRASYSQSMNTHWFSSSFRFITVWSFGRLWFVLHHSQFVRRCQVWSSARSWLVVINALC